MYQAAPSRSRSSGSMPGAWAPSTSVSIPRSASAATIRSIGKTSAVGLVTWLTSASRVRSVTRAEDRVDDRVLRRDRERDPGDDDPGAVALGDVAQDVDRGVVLVVVGQELVAGLEVERADDGVHRAGRVGDEGEVVRVGADERAEVARAVAQEARQVAGEELDRLRLHPVAPAVLRLQHRARARPERAVVQEGDRGVQRPSGAASSDGIARS